MVCFWFFCREIAVIFHSFPLTFPLFPVFLSLSLSPVPSCLFSCLSLLFILESMCHCWYIANYFFIGEKIQSTTKIKKNPKITVGIRLVFGYVYCVISRCLFLKFCGEKKEQEMEHMIRSMGNSRIIGRKIKMKAVEPVITGTLFRINKTGGSVVGLMNHKNR